MSLRTRISSPSTGVPIRSGRSGRGGTCPPQSQEAQKGFPPLNHSVIMRLDLSSRSNLLSLDGRCSEARQLLSLDGRGLRWGDEQIDLAPLARIVTPTLSAA
jgi:hypothetical protein